MRREIAPPSGGTPPPASAPLPDGEVLHLTPLANEISRRFQEEFPDEQERYGDAAFEWCVHDNQWLLAWAVEDLMVGGGHFVKNARWLARLLRARDYPVERIVRDLEIAADVVGDASDERERLAQTLQRGAAALRGRRD